MVPESGWRHLGSPSADECGCGKGAWRDTLGHCWVCGEGVVCKGMGEVEVLPGFFTGTHSPGFVWRCHGADRARCPGGRPGTCAQRRLNTSIACEECEPFTYMTHDGPCQVRWVSSVVVLPSSFSFCCGCLFIYLFFVCLSSTSGTCVKGAHEMICFQVVTAFPCTFFPRCVLLFCCGTAADKLKGFHQWGVCLRCLS